MRPTPSRAAHPAFVLTQDVGALAAIAFAIAWLYWRALFDPGVWIPAGGGDLASLIYPNYRFAAESLRAGDLPLWNPFIQGGAPFVADIQSGLLYPPNLLLFLLVPEVTYRAISALALGHVWLGGALAYACGRGLGLRRLGALAAGVAYGLSDLFVVHVGNLNLIASAAWLPLILLAAHRVGMEAGPRWIAAGGFALAMAILAGHVQPALYALVIVAVVAGIHLWRGATLGALPRASTVAPAIAGLVLLGLSATAIQLIPSAELTAHSLRAAISYEASTEYSLVPEQLISLVVPGFWGRGPANYWGIWGRTEAGYVGILTLVLATFAVVSRRDWTTRVLLAVGVVGLLLALGGYTGLHGLIYRFVPVFGSLRAPARAIVLFDLSAALLAGVGLSMLLGALSRPERRALDRLAGASLRLLAFVLALVPIGLVMLMLLRDNPLLPRATGIAEGWLMLGFWLTGAVMLLQARRFMWARASTVAALMIGWLMLDLVTNAQGLELTREDPTRGFRRAGVMEFLRTDPEPFRIDTDTGVWDVWQPNNAMVHRIPDVVGGIHPLELADFRRYWSALGSRSTPLYDLLNAKYAIARKDVPLDWNKWELAFAGDPELNVYRNTRVLPRAMLVGRASVAATHERAFERVFAPGFDPRSEVVVELGQPLDGPPQAGEARLVEYGTSSLVVEVEPTAPAYLLLSEVWYPGWRASIDGRPARVLRADYLMRAVQVRPGDRRVELWFEPTNWRIALALTAAGWLGIVVLLSLGALPRPIIARRKATATVSDRPPVSG